MNVQLYLTLEKERESVIKEAIEQIKLHSEEEINEEELAEMISEADHIHNKAIFDCVNEAMNLSRPYGIAGEPMPWSATPRKNVYLQLEDNMESVQMTLEKILQQVKNKVIRWASSYLGPINTYHGNKTQIAKLINKDENQTEKEIEDIIREEVKDIDDKDWNGLSESIHAEIKLELADFLTDYLLKDTVSVL